MRYIKLFEDMNTDSWEEISHNTFLSGVAIDFTQREFDILSKYGFEETHSDDTYRYRELRRSLDSDDLVVYVYKCDDEWYDVAIQNPQGRKYYKCDQWDGLLSYLSSNIRTLNENMNTDGYEVVADDDVMSGTRVNFTAIEFKTLSEIGFEYYPGCKDLSEASTLYYDDYGDNSDYLFIYKCDDDWFYLECDDTINKIYKCDQLHGLLSCIWDNFIKFDKNKITA